MTTDNREKIHALTNDYMEITHELKELESKQQLIRDDITAVMKESGIASHVIPGVASLSIRPTVTRYAYDTAALDALVLELLAQGTDLTDALVARIEACRQKKTTRSYLMIAKSKAKE